MVGGGRSLPTELRLGSTDVSLMFSASWIADSATSVGSLTFLGLLAISLSPHTFYASGRFLRLFLQSSPQAQNRNLCPARTASAPRRRLVRYIRKHPIG